ncbi:mp-nase [Psilogramma increta granulovirus]|uniref:Mp-nase n=1 Tax=Psilogramma increta granulovirus TaxID=2953508 RepID=A0A977TNP8_9BBAC|nr:mp-nase [Psilogramma increta granulovirus]
MSHMHISCLLIIVCVNSCFATLENLANNEYELLSEMNDENFLAKKLGSMPYIRHRVKRFFVNSNVYWRNRNHISYSLFTNNILPRLNISDVKLETHKAISVWNEAIAYDTHLPIVNLVYVGDNNDTANIKIKFLRGDHNDSFPFDGPNGVLAHAFPPPKGEVHLDADENWATQNTINNNTNNNDVINFLHTLIHEIGHSLGLFHSKIRNAIMYPFYQGNHITLDTDDLHGLDELYMRNTQNVVNNNKILLMTTTTLPPPPITPPTFINIPLWVYNNNVGKGVNKRCNIKITGVAGIRGEYYLFAPNRYWRFRDFNFTNLVETTTFHKGHWPHVCSIVSVATQAEYIHIIDHYLWYTYNTTELIKVEPLIIRYNIIFEENNVLYGVLNGVHLYRVLNNEYVGRVMDKFLGFKKIDWLLVTRDIVSVGVGVGKWVCNVIDKKNKLGNVYVVNDEPTHLMYGC